MSDQEFQSELTRAKAMQGVPKSQRRPTIGTATSVGCVGCFMVNDMGRLDSTRRGWLL